VIFEIRLISRGFNLHKNHLKSLLDELQLKLRYQKNAAALFVFSKKHLCGCVSTEMLFVFSYIIQEDYNIFCLAL